MDRDTFDINIKGSGFNIATMLITGFMFGVSISNAVYFARISDKPSEAMGSNSARAMLGINILLAALTAVIFFWSSYKLVIANEDKYDTMSKYVSNTRKHMKKLRHNAQKSMAELDSIDSTDDEMFHTGSYKVFDNPDTSSASDTDFSDF
tara:strand:- start:347 stop:796 length:450 start_codon:yes stop_codon:yes gene_type:complete